ncbi:MAG: guanylate kinase [Deltaproteobacteria bacterium]|nr:guanylate kinase [Deltaproteobacteria bacterium]
MRADNGKGRKGLMFVLSAPSGTGKTTLCRAMEEAFENLRYSVSCTTRPPRPGDEEGRDYHFISPARFQEMIDRGEFAEWAEIYGQRYGTPRAELEETLREGRDAILDIDAQGARQLSRQHLPGVFILLLPPNLEELERRLTGRKTEGRQVREERLRRARAEVEDARRWYDYLIVNDDLEKSKERLKSIIVAEHCRRERMLEVLEGIFQPWPGRE